MTSPIKIARELRQSMTPEEKLLWEALRNHRLDGWKFRRQHPIIYQVVNKKIFFYIADFYCAAKRLVVELDGKVHEFPDQKEYDDARDCIMKEMNMKVLRIKNHELKNIAAVLRKINDHLK